MELCKEGQYQGNLVDYGITENKKGDLQIWLKIGLKGSFPSGSKQCTMTWFGGFTTEKSAAFALKTIKDLGFEGNDITTLNDGPAGGALPVNCEVRVTIEESVNPNTNEPQSKIKFVNPASQKFKKAAPEKLSSLGWLKEIGEKLDRDRNESSVDSAANLQI